MRRRGRSIIHDLYRHTSGLTYGGRPDSSSPVAQAYPGGTSPAVEGDTEAVHRSPHQAAAGATSRARCSNTGSRSTCWARWSRRSASKRLGDYLADSGLASRWHDGYHVPPDGGAARPYRAPVCQRPAHRQAAAIALLDTPTKVRLRRRLRLCHRRRLPALRPDAAQRRRARRPARAEPEDGAAHDFQPPRAGHQEQRRQRRGASRRLRLRPRRGGAHAARACRRFPATPASSRWNGAYGTQFFVDPKERLVVVVGTAAPGELRKYYREQVQDIVYGAMVK